MAKNITTLTDRQAEVLNLKNGARWTFRQIAAHLKLSLSTVHEHYVDAMNKTGAMGLPKEIAPTPIDILSWRRIEEAEFIDARIRDYLKLHDEARSSGQLRTAVEALNGLHRYLETMIKLQGLAAPEKHQVQLSMADLQAELQRIEAQVGPIIEGEIQK